MAFLTSRLFFLLAFYCLFTVSACAQAGQGTVVRAVSQTNRYDRAHSLGNNYHFDPRDGWQVANISDLEYKYRRELGSTNGQRRAGTRPGQGVGGALKGLMKALKGLVGFGKSERVTITW